MPGLIDLVRDGPMERTTLNGVYINRVYKKTYLETMRTYKYTDTSGNICTRTPCMCNYKFLTEQEKKECNKLIDEMYQDWKNNKCSNNPTDATVEKFYDIDNRFFGMSYRRSQID